MAGQGDVKKRLSSRGARSRGARAWPLRAGAARSQFTHKRSTQGTCRACYGSQPGTPLRQAASNIYSRGDHMASVTADSKKWKKLTAAEKAAFIGKLCIFLITFGFAFPTIL